MKKVVNPSTQIPAGSYSATTGGYQSRFRTMIKGIGHYFVVEFETGMRGLNYPDTITVGEDGSIVSTVLPGNGRLVSVAKEPRPKPASAA